jgi:hypothetical protein
MLEKWLGYSLPGNGNGSRDSDSSLTESGNGTTHFSYSVTEKGNGTTDLSSSLTGNGKASLTFGSSIPENGKASPNEGSSLSEKENALQHAHVTLPEKIDPAQLSLFSIRAKVKTATGYKGRNSGLDATARLFIHLYNGGDGGYPALCRATKLSMGGIGKMLMSLRKKGLIKNKGYRQPALTEKALNILRHAWAARFSQGHSE